MLHKWLIITFAVALYAGQVASLECYSCDSNEDVECAIRPGQQINVEECVHDNDHCVTVVVAGITKRGCLSRIFPNNYCPEPCEKCDKNLCNRNIFPPNRLRCYQCTGPSCLDVQNKKDLLMPCPVYHENDRCYMNVVGTSNVHRGCERTNNPSTCPNTCLRCDYDGCNNEVGVFEETCYQCRHTSLSPNPDCIRNQVATTGGGGCNVRGLKTCKNKVLHGHASRCFVYVNEQTDVVERGCSTTKGFYPTGNLTECIGKNCNTQCLTISCNDCSSALDGSKCRSGLNLRPKRCEEGTFACYSCESGPQIRRGCANSSFVPTPKEACYQCRSLDGCNRTPIRTCYTCSSLQQADCSKFTEPFYIPMRNCGTSDELCVSTVVRRLDLVYTIRGCASNVHECTLTDPYCVRCNGSLCNTNPIALQYEQQSGRELIDERNGQSRSVASTKFIIALSIILLNICTLY